MFEGLQQAGGHLVSAFTAVTQGNWSELGTSLTQAFQAVAQDPASAAVVFGLTGLAAGGALGVPLLGAIAGGLAGYFGNDAVEAVRRGPEPVVPTR